MNERRASIAVALMVAFGTFVGAPAYAETVDPVESPPPVEPVEPVEPSVPDPAAPAEPVVVPGAPSAPVSPVTPQVRTPRTTTKTPTPTASPTPAPTDTASPTSTVTPTATPRATPTPSPTRAAFVELTQQSGAPPTDPLAVSALLGSLAAALGVLAYAAVRNRAALTTWLRGLLHNRTR